MNKKVFSLSALLFASTFTSGCALLTETPATENQLTETVITINNYPTRDRVEYVFNCIAKHGGKLDYVSQYACGCKIDKIAEKMSFSEYEAASTFTMLRSTPGENGAAFRDPKHAKSLRTRLKEAEKRAESLCFVK